MEFELEKILVIPLLFFALILADSTDVLKKRYLKGVRSINATKIAAIIFILAGINVNDHTFFIFKW
jgi:hypothetical protein